MNGITSAFIYVALVLVAPPFNVLVAGENVPAPISIEPVKTWSDLVRQPVVALHKNATARFGVQALRGPRNSGVMIYCMTEAFDPADEDDMQDDDRLGPFRLAVVGAEKNEVETLEKSKTSHEPGKRDYGRLLFAQIIPLDKVGSQTINVMNGNDVVVAAVKIECVKAPFHAWSALVQPDDGEEIPDEVSDDTRIPIRPLRTASGNASLPKLPGGVPMRYALAGGARGPKKFEDNDPLPLLPEPAAQGADKLTAAQEKQAARAIAELGSDHFNLREGASKALIALGRPVLDVLNRFERMTADAETLCRLRLIVAQLDGPFLVEFADMTLTVKTQIAFPCVDFEDRFLARWWVNGRPVKPAKDGDGTRYSTAPNDDTCKRARFNLKFDRKALGAKSGDKISVQMLYCPDGTQTVLRGDLTAVLEESENDKEEEAAEEFPDRFPVLSNRIEFVAP